MGAQVSGGAPLFHQGEVSGGQVQDSWEARVDGSFVSEWAQQITQCACPAFQTEPVVGHDNVFFPSALLLPAFSMLCVSHQP